ncbi:MAG: sensor histidine kinase [Actinomycetota bacterium]
MKQRLRTRLALAALIVMFLLFIPTLWLSILNGSLSDDPFFISTAMAMIIGYGIVGSFISARTEDNPIGWLLMAAGTGFLIAGGSSEYATYAYLTSPGSLPLPSLFGWLSHWSFLLVLLPIPLILVLFPNGRVPSRRWRLFPAFYVALVSIAAVTTMFTPGNLDINERIKVMNPVGIESLGPFISVLGSAVAWAVLPTSLASIAALALRFRRASGEERQQIRWLAYVAALGGIVFIGAFASSIGLKENETRLVSDLFFYAFMFCVGIGIPVAAGVAILKYRLWDLDVVIKKTVVATIVVGLILIVSLVVLVIGTGPLFELLAGEPTFMLLLGIALGFLLWPLRKLARRIADRVVYGGRATPYEVLTEFSGRMADTVSTEEVLPRMAGIVGQGTGARRVQVWLRLGRDLTLTAAWPENASGEAHPMNGDSLPALGEPAFEVQHQGELLGALTVAMPANDPMNESKERLIRDIASQAGLVLRNVRLIEEVRASRRRLVAAQDEERRKLERNLHDGAQQQLVALTVKLRLAEGATEKDPAKAKDILAQVQTDANDAIQTLRDLARGIYPPLLADKGLTAALEAQGNKAAIPVAVEADGVTRYNQEIEAAIYFCCLEGLQNIAKYANASRAVIRLAKQNDELSFSLQDDGAGFDPEVRSSGTGLQNMADRIETLGGKIDIRSSAGAGTKITGRLPIGEPE